MTHTVVGLFRDPEEARSVVHDLLQKGFASADVSLIASDERGGTVRTAGDGESATSGAGSGAAIGGLAGLALGLAALVIPGVGPIIAAGPIAAALTGAGIGAAAGGLLGALSHMGVPEDEANFYAEGLRQGGTLVTVHTNDARAEEARSVLDRHGALDVEDEAAGPGAVEAAIQEVAPGRARVYRRT